MSKWSEETCAVCGEGRAHERSRSLPKVLLGHTVRYPRREFVCSACSETYTDREQGEANERAERAAIRRALAVIGPKEILIARQFANATQREMEKLLGLGRNTLARWETGQRPIPDYIKATFRLIGLNPLAADLLAERPTEAQTESAEVIDFALYLSSRYMRGGITPRSDAVYIEREVAIGDAIGT